MSTTVNDLPYEILSKVLELAAELNTQSGSQYTYGLSQAPEPLQDVRMQKVVRGRVPPDTLRWNATEAIRRVRRQWHNWACEYALENLYITRWRGSERYVTSTTNLIAMRLTVVKGGCSLDHWTNYKLTLQASRSIVTPIIRSERLLNYSSQILKLRRACVGLSSMGTMAQRPML